MRNATYNSINNNNNELVNNTFSKNMKKKINILLIFIILIFGLQVTTTTFFILNENVLRDIYNNNTHLSYYIYRLEKIIDYVCKNEKIC